MYYVLARAYRKYYTAIAERLIEAGAPEICLKDMAGVGAPKCWDV